MKISFLGTVMISLGLFWCLKEAEMKIAMFAILKSITEILKILRVYMILGDAVSKFDSYFKVHNLVSVHPKSIILNQMINLGMIFHVVVSVCQLVKI